MTWQQLLKKLKELGYKGGDTDLGAVRKFVDDEMLDLDFEGKALDIDSLHKVATAKKRVSLDGAVLKDEAEQLKVNLKSAQDELEAAKEALELKGFNKPKDGEVNKAIHDVQVGKDRLADDPFAGYGKGRLGEMYLDIVKCAGNSEGPGRVEKGGKLDLWHKAALSSYAAENVGADGGFLVPPDTTTIVDRRVMGEASLLSMTNTIRVSGNSFTEPRDETTPWGTSGIQAYWEGEAGTYTQSKPVFNAKTWILNKVTALVPASDEVLQDATGLASYINEKAPEMIDFKIGEAIVRGTGAGMPVGYLNSAGTLSISAESGQPADTFKATNAQKMIQRMYGPYLRNSRWLIHPDVTVQLHQAVVVGKTDAGTTVAVGGLIFNPQSQAGAPFGSLYTRPIMYTQHAETLGDVGDVTLADLSQYRSVIKGTGLETAISIHFWFDQGVQAFRFTFRMGGGPKFDTTISPRDGSNTMAAFVTVAAR